MGTDSLLPRLHAVIFCLSLPVKKFGEQIPGMVPLLLHRTVGKGPFNWPFLKIIKVLPGQSHSRTGWDYLSA